MSGLLLGVLNVERKQSAATLSEMQRAEDGRKALARNQMRKGSPRLGTPLNFGQIRFEHDLSGLRLSAVKSAATFNLRAIGLSVLRLTELGPTWSAAKR